MAYVDKAVQAHLGSTLHMVFTGLNEKVADITHADTAKHTIDCVDLGLPANCVLLLLFARRIVGTGSLDAYPIEGTTGIRIGTGANHYGVDMVVPIVNGRLQYSLTVANDDFDLYCIGYLTSGRVLG